MNRRSYNYYLDRGRPVLSASAEIAIEGSVNITLVCNGSNLNSIVSYNFYKYEVEEKKSAENIYLVGRKRSNNGNYSCAAMRNIRWLSAISSNVIAVQFLCK